MGQGTPEAELGGTLVIWWLVVAIVAVGILIVGNFIRANKTFKEITKP